jgi:hypothetical protein
MLIRAKCHCTVIVACLGAANVARASEEVLHFYSDLIKNPNDNKDKGERRYRNSAGTALGLLDLDSDGANDDSRVVYPFSLTQSMNPRQYSTLWPEFEYRVHGNGAVFYGGIQAQYLNMQKTRIHQAFVHHEGADFNRIEPVSGRPRRSGAPPSPAANPVTGELYEQYTEITLFTYHPPEHTSADQLSTFQAAFLWKAEDFVNVGPGQQVVFDDQSEIMITTTRKWDNIGESRFLVQDGDGRFYLSQGWTGVEALIGTDVALKPVESLWAPWDPLADPFDFAFDAATATFLAHEFSSVLSVGVYLAQNVFSNLETKLTFDQFRTTATVITPGDFDGDDDVDGADFLVWQQQLGQTGSVLQADGDRNGLVDADDYALWKARFGTGRDAASYARARSVAEPATAAAWSVGPLWLALAARRREIWV